ncbi:MAG: hypothetical protein ABI599_07775 [Flavobacteriales bacterium]
MSQRNLLLAASALVLAGLHAQDVPPPTNNDRKEPSRNSDRQDPRPPDQGTTPMAGSPGDRWDSRNAQQVQDSAFASLLLDPGQAKRIADMERRYAEEFARVGTADRNDPAYRKVWDRRRTEIQSILTPVQYKRWQELNAGHFTPAPTEMPTAQPDKNVAPMPTMRIDTLPTDKMPVLQDSLKALTPK